MTTTLVTPPVIPVTGGGVKSRKGKFDTTPYEQDGLKAPKTQDGYCTFVTKDDQKFLVMLKPESLANESNNAASIVLVPVKNPEDDPMSAREIVFHIVAGILIILLVITIGNAFNTIGK